MFGLLNYDKKPPTIYDLINSNYNYNNDEKIRLCSNLIVLRFNPFLAQSL